METFDTEATPCYVCHSLILVCYSKKVMLNWVGPLLLCSAELERIPDGIPGVYLLHVFAPRAGAYPAVYAGRSRDLRHRLLTHGCARSAKPIVRAVRNAEQLYWSAAPIASSELRAASEAALIRLLKPVCNDQIPTVAPAAVNLPPMLLGS